MATPNQTRSKRLRRRAARAQRALARARDRLELQRVELRERMPALLDAMLPPPPSENATVYNAPDGKGMAWREPDGTTRVVMWGSDAPRKLRSGAGFLPPRSGTSG